MYFTWDAAVGNSHATESAGLECPVVRDNTTSSTALSSGRIDVFNNGNDLSCAFIANDPASLSYFPINRSTTAVGYTPLDFTSLTGFADWFTVINCFVPEAHPTNGHAFVKAIKVSEP